MGNSTSYQDLRTHRTWSPDGLPESGKNRLTVVPLGVGKRPHRVITRGSLSILPFLNPEVGNEASKMTAFWGQALLSLSQHLEMGMLYEKHIFHREFWFDVLSQDSSPRLEMFQLAGITSSSVGSPQTIPGSPMLLVVGSQRLFPFGASFQNSAY